MAITFITNYGTSPFLGGSFTADLNVDITVGQSIIIASYAGIDSFAPTITDSYGNTYAAAKTGNSNLFVFEQTNLPFGGTGGHITATYPSNGQTVSLYAATYSGFAASSEVETTFATNSGGPTALWNFFSSTLANAGDLVAYFAVSGQGPITDTGHGFTDEGGLNGNPNQFRASDQVFPTASAVTIDVTLAGSPANIIGALVVIKASAGNVARNLDTATKAAWQRRVNRGDASRTTRWIRDAGDLWNKRRSGIFVPRGFYPEPAPA